MGSSFSLSFALSSPTAFPVAGAAILSPKLVLSAATLPENAPVNTVIGTLSVERAPGGVTYSYALISNPGNRFNISGASLRSSAVLDFETAASHTVTIRATGSDASVIDQAFVIAVTNLNHDTGHWDDGRYWSDNDIWLEVA